MVPRTASNSREIHDVFLCTYYNCRLILSTSEEYKNSLPYDFEVQLKGSHSTHDPGRQRARNARVFDLWMELLVAKPTMCGFVWQLTALLFHVLSFSSLRNHGFSWPAIISSWPAIIVESSSCLLWGSPRPGKMLFRCETFRGAWRWSRANGRVNPWVNPMGSFQLISWNIPTKNGWWRTFGVALW